MGEVYLARDQTLDRDVALKILPPELVQSEERVRRFVLEAKSASSLNHPHIVTIYEIGRDKVRSGDGGATETSVAGIGAAMSGTAGGDALEPDSSALHFIAMELVRGKTLASKIYQEKTDLKTLLGWLAQAAEGLAKAHAAGIVHRDLKPGNIMISHDGYAKVLDFGLAKLIERQAAGPGLSSAPTVTEEEGTSDGVVLGTADYMAPEQVRGKPVDARSDIFSFGCMLYEAATRRRPFAAESKVETMHRILHEPPVRIVELNPEVPAELRRLIQRCLAKDANQRLDSMRSLALELREIVDEYDALSVSPSSGDAGAATAPRRRAALSSAFPVAMAVVAILSGWLVWKRPWQFAPASRSQPPGWRQITFGGVANSGDISTDGSTITYLDSGTDGFGHVMVQDVSGGEPVEAFRGLNLLSPRWSGSGSDIVVLGSSVDSTLGLWLVPRMGGQPRALPSDGRGGIARLSPDGTYLAQIGLPWRRILIRRLSSGDTTWIDLVPRFTWLEEVNWSPDGERLLCIVRDERGFSVWTMRRDGRHQQKVYDDPDRIVPVWSPRGDAIYLVRRTGQRGELIKVYLKPDGSAGRRAPRVLVSEPDLRQEAIGVSRDGRRLACTRGTQYSNLWLWDPARGGRGGVTRQLTKGTAFIRSPAVSPDGQRVAYLSDRSGVANVHVLSLGDGKSRQLTFLEHDATGIAWSPDGKAVAFVSSDGESSRVWRVAVGGGVATPFKRTIVGATSLAWSPNHNLLYLRPGNRNFHILDPETESERPLVANDWQGWMFFPSWSPDGRHVAVFWNRRERGLWAMSTDDTVQIRLAGWLNFGACKWGVDGSAILYVPEEPPWRVLRVGFPRGDTTTVLRIPLDEDRGDAGQMDFTPDLRRIVYATVESNTDIWLLEDFDPEMK